MTGRRGPRRDDDRRPAGSAALPRRFHRGRTSDRGGPCRRSPRAEGYEDGYTALAPDATIVRRVPAPGLAHQTLCLRRSPAWAPARHPGPARRRTRCQAGTRPPVDSRLSRGTPEPIRTHRRPVSGSSTCGARITAEPAADVWTSTTTSEGTVACSDTVRSGRSWSGRSSDCTPRSMEPARSGSFCTPTAKRSGRRQISGSDGSSYG